MLPLIGSKPVGEQLGEGRFAVAVRAQKRDAVILVDAQIEIAQHRLAAIADAHVFKAQQAAARAACGSGNLNCGTGTSAAISIGVILASIFRRLCAWRAFEAL